MTLLNTIAFLLATAGVLILLELSPFFILEELKRLTVPKKISLRNQIRKNRKPKQPRGIRLLIIETKELLQLTGKIGMFLYLCMISMSLFVVGVLAAISLQNRYLVPVLAVGLSLLPFYYIKIVAGRYKKQINAELEAALSVITTSYLRGNNTIIRAIEENQPYLNPPVAEVFRNFLIQTKLINSNLAEGLEGLKHGVDNAVFHEWVEAVIACQQDHNLKATLLPIVAKLSDIRTVTAELELLLFDPIKEYITMLILLFGSVPLMYLLNKAWYRTLMFTEFGKILLTICGVVVFVSIAAVAKHTRAIEYKR